MDPLLPSYDRHSWLILRKWENKYDLAAKYPKWADRIVQLSAGIDIGDTRLTYTVSRDESDVIPVYHAFHKQTPAVKDGRYIIFIDDEIICADGKLWDEQKADRLPRNPALPNGWP
jgi:hypothetical protein